MYEAELSLCWISWGQNWSGHQSPTATVRKHSLMFLISPAVYAAYAFRDRIAAVLDLMRTELKWPPESNSLSAEAFSYVFLYPLLCTSMQRTLSEVETPLCWISWGQNWSGRQSPTASARNHSLMFFISPAMYAAYTFWGRIATVLDLMRTELKWLPESNSLSVEVFSYVFHIPCYVRVSSLHFLR